MIASPIVGDELKKEDNTHHAHIELCDELDATFNAFYLRELFTRSGSVENIAPSDAAKPRDNFIKDGVNWVRNGLVKFLNWKRNGQK